MKKNFKKSGKKFFYMEIGCILAVSNNKNLIKMETTINLNEFKAINVTEIVSLTGIKNYYTSHPLCIQKARLLRDAKSMGLLELVIEHLNNKN